MSILEIEFRFPNLKNSGYTSTSPETIDYNCIAWAAGDVKNWWDPIDHYWPLGVERKLTLEAFIKAFETLGYIVCSDAIKEEGFEKIAIYKDQEGYPSHAARQLDSGCWTSKLGKMEDIEHDALDGFEDSIYGSVAVLMKRPK